MGYRSEVGLCLAGSAQAKLEASLLKLANKKGAGNASKTKLIQTLFQEAILKKDKASGTTAYYWESIKWYDDYSDVSFVEAFLEKLNEDDYLFIRLGESDDDNEIKGDFWDNPLHMSMIKAVVFE
jgi:hypothetical protein